MTQPIVELLDHFAPDGEALLREISSHIDDEMLHWISQTDYGLGADEHMVALRQVRDTGTFPDEMYWFPMEVLELIRWSEPDHPNWAPVGVIEFGHWVRAFACAAILRAEHEPYSYSCDDGSTSSTVIQLISSLRALPVDLNAKARGCLSWLILRSEPEGSNKKVLEYGIGLLWLRFRGDELRQIIY